VRSEEEKSRRENTGEASEIGARGTFYPSRISLTYGAPSTGSQPCLDRRGKQKTPARHGLSLPDPCRPGTGRRGGQGGRKGEFATFTDFSLRLFSVIYRVGDV
jgi:hypothetical protein